MGQLQSRKGSRDERELQACGQQQVVPSWALLAAASIREHRRFRGAQLIPVEVHREAFQSNRARVGKTDDRFDASWGEGQSGSFSHV